MVEPAIDLNDLRFAWKSGEAPVLDIASFRVSRGERLFVKGPSGSGKTTLLGVIGGVFLPSQGSVTVLGHHLAQLSPSGRDRFRADHVGFVFQMFNLLPYLSVTENVLLPLSFSPARRDRLAARGVAPETEARRLVAALGLDQAHLLTRRVGELSVGQQQRVAAARALMGQPEIIIADEPTSALDADAREVFLQLLFKETRDHAITLVFVSHDASLAKLFDRGIAMAEINRAPQGQPS